MQHETTGEFLRRFAEQLADPTKSVDQATRAAARAAGARVVKRPDPAPLVRRLLAACYAERGIGPSAIGRSMGISPSLAREWVRKGRKGWREDPAAARRLLVDVLGEPVVEVALAGIDLTRLTEPTPSGVDTGVDTGGVDTPPTSPETASWPG